MGLNGCRFTMRQFMELDACTRCGECLKACETYGKSGNDDTAPAYKLKQFRAILMGEGRGLFFSRLFKKAPSEAELQGFAKGVYSCTLCSRCAEVCPAKIDLLGLWFSMRQELADREVHPQNLNIAR
ncbi:MAG: (Fe-S)-binding protein, partial [Dehalococcoidia bacterium]|nr:(Fe-S)-binding protein [Dehalococcoidia bacterium]